MDTLFCRGTEERIVNCTFNPNTDNHSHRDDVGVSCLPGPGVCLSVYFAACSICLSVCLFVCLSI